MFARAVIFTLAALFLALVADNLPSPLNTIAPSVCYIMAGFAVVSALLSLFEAPEDQGVNDFEQPSGPLRIDF